MQIWDHNLITVLAVTVAGLVQAWNRRQDRKERHEKAAEVTASFAGHRETTRLQTSEVIGEIQKNTGISVEAFKEANSVNAKIANLNARILDNNGRILDINKRIEESMAYVNKRLG